MIWSIASRRLEEFPKNAMQLFENFDPGFEVTLD